MNNIHIGLVILIVAIGAISIVSYMATMQVTPGQACINSGGTVASANCCLSSGDFPNTCLIGPCGCSPDNSHEVSFCDCGDGCWDGSSCVSQ